MRKPKAFFAAFALMIFAPAFARADNELLKPPSITDLAKQTNLRRSWERSLLPLLASQSLDAASSYGRRELNPLLADANGGFGMKATTMKFAVVGALIGVEYLVVRRHPRAAGIFSKINWSGAAVTTGLAMHNFSNR